MAPQTDVMKQPFPGPGEFGTAHVAGYGVAEPERTHPHCPYESRSADGNTVFRCEEEGLLLAERILTHTDEAVIVAGALGIVLRVNEAYTRITGYGADEARGRKLPLLLAGEGQHRAVWTQMWQELLRHGAWQGELWSRRKNGETFPQRLKITAIRDAAQRVTHYVAIASDISRQKHDGELIDQMRRLDPLTGLPNRELLSLRLQQALSTDDTQPLAVLHLDIDDLKSINQTVGQGYGDYFIQTIAERLVRGVGAENTVARRGGDEFCILLHRPDSPESVTATGKRLLALVSEPLPLLDEEYVLTASLGISLSPGDAADVEGLLSHASLAMQLAKQEGGNDLRFYSPALSAAIQERQAIDKGLRLAIERGEFALHYQPQISMATGRVVGVEALLRWRHPEMGMVSPARFIPIAEETGKIVAIGDWVLREACRQGRAWHDAGFTGLQVAVNLSPRQFRQANLVQRIADALAASGFAPGALELEITEGALMADPAQAAEVLRQLKRSGVRFSVDDFGTGYSSLGYLKRFDLDSLKIDRSFIGNCCRDRHDAAIVEAVIGLSHSLGLEVVAEGVEDEAQLAFVRRAGCDLVQGYFYSPALAPAQLPAVLADPAGLRRQAVGVPA